MDMQLTTTIRYHGTDGLMDAWIAMGRQIFDHVKQSTDPFYEQTDPPQFLRESRKYSASGKIEIVDDIPLFSEEEENRSREPHPDQIALLDIPA